MVTKTSKKTTLSPVQQKLTDDVNKSNAKRGIGIPMPSGGGTASTSSTQIIRVTKLGKQMAMRGNALPAQCQVICSLISQLEKVEGEGCMMKELAESFQTWANIPQPTKKGKNSTQTLGEVFNGHWAGKMLGNTAWVRDKHTSVTQQICGSDTLTVVEYV
jgi:hypothetical protein